jgi:hypothetical protein
MKKKLNPFGIEWSCYLDWNCIQYKSVGASIYLANDLIWGGKLILENNHSTDMNKIDEAKHHQYEVWPSRLHTIHFHGSQKLPFANTNLALL